MLPYQLIYLFSIPFMAQTRPETRFWHVLPINALCSTIINQFELLSFETQTATNERVVEAKTKALRCEEKQFPRRLSFCS